MDVELQKKLSNEIIKGLENGEKVEDIAKRNFKSVQEIKAILARVGDEKSKQLLKQIIETQVPEIEEITRKYIEEKYSPDALSAEYGIYNDKIRKFISEYVFVTNQEEEYNERRKHKETTRYKPKEKNTNGVDIVIAHPFLQNKTLKEGEDR